MVIDLFLLLSPTAAKVKGSQGLWAAQTIRGVITMVIMQLSCRQLLTSVRRCVGKTQGMDGLLGKTNNGIIIEIALDWIIPSFPISSTSRTWDWKNMEKPCDVDFQEIIRDLTNIKQYESWIWVRPLKWKIYHYFMAMVKWNMMTAYKIWGCPSGSSMDAPEIKHGKDKDPRRNNNQSANIARSMQSANPKCLLNPKDFLRNGPGNAQGKKSVVLQKTKGSPRSLKTWGIHAWVKYTTLSLDVCLLKGVGRIP